MREITIDQVMAWRPCNYDGENDGRNYTRQRVEILFSGRDVLTATDIDALDIPTNDKIWVLLHGEFLSDEQMYSLACDFAERVLHLTDPHAAAIINARRAWLRGEVDDCGLAAVWDAAWTAWEAIWDVWASGEDTAWVAREAARASWVTVWTTAREAAWDAARVAVRAIARATAIDAAKATGKDPAWVAAWEAGWETAWRTARDVEQQWQMEQLVERIETDAN